MPYELRPETIKTFVNDTTIELPRFQRQLTWEDRKNFNLCLSLYKQFPLGVVVLKMDEKPKGPAELRKFLLDGRQRREAFKQMRNPENIYRWAKTSLKLKQSDTEEDIRSKFRGGIERFFGEDEIELAALSTAAKAHDESIEASSEEQDEPAEGDDE